MLLGYFSIVPCLVTLISVGAAAQSIANAPGEAGKGDSHAGTRLLYQDIGVPAAGGGLNGIKLDDAPGKERAVTDGTSNTLMLGEKAGGSTSASNQPPPPPPPPPPSGHSPLPVLLVIADRQYDTGADLTIAPPAGGPVPVPYPNTGLASLKGIGSIERLANGGNADAAGGAIRHRTFSIVDRTNVSSDGGSGGGGGCTVACQNNLNPSGGGTQAYGTGIYGPSAGGARVAVGDVNNAPSTSANSRTLTVGGAKTETVQGLPRK
ncbi:MAG: DUF1559 domain-containing protein [Alphaproteobacteria bacterium]|nr:DUF1559 domain-containing protein [Alphaproteobacteria bacterium]